MSLLRFKSIGPRAAVVAVALLTLSACHSSTARSPERKATAKPAQPSVERILRLLSLGSPSTSVAATAIAQLEADRRTSAPADVPLYDKALAMLGELQLVLGPEVDITTSESHQHLAAAVGHYIELLRLVALRYPDDLPIARMVVGTMSSLPGVVGNFELESEFDPAALQREAVALARALVQRFPNDAPARGLLGQTASSLDVLEAMRAFQSCTVLDPTLEGCRTRLEEMRADYVRPYCDGPQIRSDLAWKAAVDRPEPGFAPVPTSAGVPGPLYVLSTPRFTARDVQLIRLRAEGTRPELTMTLRPEARAPFATWQSELHTQDRFVVLVVGDEPKMRGPRSSFRGPVDSFMLFGLTLAELCTSTSNHTLPADLAR